MSGRIISIVALAASLSATAAGAAMPHAAAHFAAAVTRQCPAKHLDMLAPAELRDALDSYASHLPADLRLAMDRSESRQCRHVRAGATCANMSDIDIAERRHMLPALAASVCGQFELCREQSDCDPVSARALQQSIERTGPAAVATALSQSQWSLALDEAAGGRADWIDAIAALRPTTDGAKAEGIDLALSDALRTNPSEVLRLVSVHPNLPRATWLCADRAIEPARSVAKRHIEAAMAAVTAVNDPQLQGARDQCLASLKRAAG